MALHIVLYKVLSDQVQSWKLENMKVLANNCVSRIKIPKRVESATAVDYSPVLDVFVSYNLDQGVAVWDPASRKIIARFRDVGEGFCDTLFLPGDRVAVSSSEGHHGGTLAIYTFDKNKSKPTKFFTIARKHLKMSYPGSLALSPDKKILITDAFNPGVGVYEISMDWNALKVLQSREIIPGDAETEYAISLLCCSQDFEVATYIPEESVLTTAKVCLNSEGKTEVMEQCAITYYMLDGEKREIGENVNGLVHDGQNLIIANEKEIVLLESMTEGSNAHLIASNITPSAQMRINHEGQLMVCEGKVIKMFEYSCNPRSLQALCRFKIRKTIHADYREIVKHLAIPGTLKDYLLYE